MSYKKKILILLFDKENSVLHKIPNQKNILMIISLIIFLIGFLNKSDIEKDELLFKPNLVLEKAPKYGENFGKGKGSWIQLKFENDEVIYYVESYVYKTFSHDRFKKEIKKGDTLSIGVLDNKIYSLTKKEFDYCNLQIAMTKKKLVLNSFMIIGVVSLLSLIILKRLEKKRINENWGIIWLVTIVITIVILIYK